MIKTYIDDKIMEKYFKGRDVFLRNPYKPGAGTAPEYLAGRGQILEDATNNLNELCEGGMPVHTIYYGVRGVGKQDKRDVDIHKKFTICSIVCLPMIVYIIGKKSK